MTYGITVTGGWFDSNGTPFGMSLSPTLTGSITVDNTIAGIAGMLDFELTTGSHSWTETEFVGPTGALTYNGSGTLTGFSLNSFAFSGGTMTSFRTTPWASLKPTSGTTPATVA